MKDYLQTVTGPVAREDMGLTLPHEHLFNDLSSVVDAPCYPFSQRLVDKKVTAEIQWALKHDPYCCADNMDRKPIEDVIFEINNFISLGGRTIVDATGSESIGRDAQALREVALKTGLNIVASSGPYLEKFESQRIHKTVDELATTIDKELNQGIGDTDIRAGMIGEIGVSPTFTEAEHNSLRAASLAQINNPHVAMNIHMPGWLRRGDEVLDIVLGEMLEGILLSECERLKQHSLANKLISLFRQFGGTELRLKLVWLCWLDLMTGNSLDDWTKNLKHKSEKDLEQWIIARQGQSEPLTNLMDQYVLMAYRTSVDAAHS